MPTEFWFDDRLEPGEVAVLVLQAGSGARLFQLLAWVLDAHTALERRELPLASRCSPASSVGREQPVMSPDAHARAVSLLEERLRHCVAIAGVTHWQLRARLLEMIPGIIFPEPTSRAEFDALIAAARNLNAWLATRGTFCCRCPAVEFST